MESVQPANAVDRWAGATPELSEEVGRAAPLGARQPDWRPVSGMALKRAVNQIGLDARRGGWSPESLLVAIKSALQALPSVQHLTSGARGDEFVAHLVSLCSDEH